MAGNNSDPNYFVGEPLPTKIINAVLLMILFVMLLSPLWGFALALAILRSFAQADFGAGLD